MRQWDRSGDRQRGQAIILLALALTAMCGMLALAIDAGRLYFQRRLMQDAVDGGALAGAQDLVGTPATPNGQPNYALFHAIEDTLAVFKLLPTYTDPTLAPYSPAPPGTTVTDSKGGYTVTVVAPSGYNNKQVQVTVSFAATTTFAQILGFSQISIQATATAEAGTNAKTYALFAYTSGGSGNTIQDDQNGYAQIDDGQDGKDACSASAAGLTMSNAKYHVPAPPMADLNINGAVTVNSASDNHGLFSFWQTPVTFGTGVDAKPNYLIPDTSGTAKALNPTKNKIAPGTSAVVNGVTITNSSPSKWVFVYTPGKYTTTVAIPGAGDPTNSIYIFLNGLYYFTSGANLTITAGYVSNTSTGLPHYAGSPAVGATDLPPAPDGTNGVEFVFDGLSTFSANNSSFLPTQDGSVFFVAPSFVPTGSTNIAFYIASTNGTLGAVWSETFSATLSSVPRFQIWGTVFDADPSGSMTLTGVQLGPHNTAPTDLDSSGQYAINGEFIGAFLQLNNGNVFGNAAGTPAACPGPIGPGKPALLVQFNTLFAPAPGVNSYLIK